jgi:hypothetical protein
MAPEDEHLTRLVNDVFDKGNHRIALGLASALIATSSTEGPTPRQLSEIAAAEASCGAAERALNDYQASMILAESREHPSD